MSHTVNDAKKLVVEIRNTLRSDHTISRADSLIGRSEKALTDLVECVEHLSNPARSKDARTALADAMTALRAEVWRVNDKLHEAAGPYGIQRVSVAELTKARNRALKAIDKMESLLNVESTC